MTFHRRLVLLYGDSLFFEGISASLSLHARIDLTVEMVKLPTDFSTLINLHPNLILVDASQFSPIRSEELHSAFPEEHRPSVIRLDLDKQHLTVVSTQQFPAASLDELEQAFEIILNSM
jgi:hypothetical protein